MIVQWRDPCQGSIGRIDRKPRRVLLVYFRHVSKGFAQIATRAQSSPLMCASLHVGTHYPRASECPGCPNPIIPLKRLSASLVMHRSRSVSSSAEPSHKMDVSRVVSQPSTFTFLALLCPLNSAISSSPYQRSSTPHYSYPRPSIVHPLRHHSSSLRGL